MSSKPPKRARYANDVASSSTSGGSKFFKLPFWLVLKINDVLNPLYLLPFFHVKTEKCSTKRKSLRLRSKTERVVQPRKGTSYSVLLFTCTFTHKIIP